MLRYCVVTLTLLFAAAAASAQTGAPPSPSSQAPVKMTPTQIAAYNSELFPSDPAFIKCVRMENPGSMVKRRVCRTKGDWDQRAEAASAEARAIVDRIQTQGSSNSQEPPGSIVPMSSD